MLTFTEKQKVQKPTLIQDYTNKEFQIILNDIVAKLALNSTLWIHIRSNEMQVSKWCSFRQTNFKNFSRTFQEQITVFKD